MKRSEREGAKGRKKTLCQLFKKIQGKNSATGLGAGRGEITSIQASEIGRGKMENWRHGTASAFRLVSGKPYKSKGCF